MKRVSVEDCTIAVDGDPASRVPVPARSGGSLAGNGSEGLTGHHSRVRLIWVPTGTRPRRAPVRGGSGGGTRAWCRGRGATRGRRRTCTRGGRCPNGRGMGVLRSPGRSGNRRPLRAQRRLRGGAAVEHGLEARVMCSNDPGDHNCGHDDTYGDQPCRPGSHRHDAVPAVTANRQPRCTLRATMAACTNPTVGNLCQAMRSPRTRFR